jgi:hypothetical protein
MLKQKSYLALMVMASLLLSACGTDVILRHQATKIGNPNPTPAPKEDISSLLIDMAGSLEDDQICPDYILEFDTEARQVTAQFLNEEDICFEETADYDVTDEVFHASLSSDEIAITIIIIDGVLDLDIQRSLSDETIEQWSHQDPPPANYTPEEQLEDEIKKIHEEVTGITDNNPTYKGKIDNIADEFNPIVSTN